MHMSKSAFAKIHRVGLPLLLAWFCVAASAETAAIELTGADSIPLHDQRQALVPAGSVSITDVVAGRLDRQLGPGDGPIVALGPDNELWMRFRLHNPSGRPVAWDLEFPLPAIDQVSLFVQRGSDWTELVAGDRIAMRLWPREGRFPRFGLEFEPGESRQLIIRVRNAVPAPLTLRLSDDAATETADQRAYLGYGIALGALLLLVLACVVQAALYASVAYAWYGAYVALLGLALSAFTGLANQFIWGEYPQWGDASKAVLTLASAGASVLFVRTLCSVQTRSRFLSVASALAGALVIGIAAVLAFLPVAAPWLYGMGMLVAAGIVLTIGAFTARRGDPVGAWVLAAHVPLIVVSALIVLRNLGLAPFSFDSNLLAALAIAVILPMLLTALHLRSKEMLALQMRGRELASADPLTGLLALNLFTDRVAAAVNRYRKSRHNAVVLCVRMANQVRIREIHGSAVADQSMVRAAMKLRSVMPDADCVGRVGEGTIGLILESVTARDAIMRRAARLVAHGLMPLEGMKPEVSLHFHVVANILSENPQDAVEMLAALQQMLASMSPRTRRPIRFLEPGAIDRASPAGDLETDDDTILEERD